MNIRTKKKLHCFSNIFTGKKIILSFTDSIFVEPSKSSFNIQKNIRTTTYFNNTSMYPVISKGNIIPFFVFVLIKINFIMNKRRDISKISYNFSNFYCISSTKNSISISPSTIFCSNSYKSSNICSNIWILVII